MSKYVYKAMTIAGSDASGGAGLEADLKTFQEFGVYGMAAVTTIVTMNPADWSHEVFPVELKTVEKQIETIVSTGINAMKTGMLGSPELVELVDYSIKKHDLKNIVIDPVMVCKGVDDILVPTAAEAIKKLLVKHATVITPNIIEAAYLADMPPIKNMSELQDAAERIKEMGAKIVIIKGGTRFDPNKAIDIIHYGKELHDETQIISLDVIKPAYNHGAGCTYSAALTANLAKGISPSEAIKNTITFIRAALSQSFPLKKFTGPVRHDALRNCQ